MFGDDFCTLFTFQYIYVASVYMCLPFTDILCNTCVCIILWIPDDGHNTWPKHVEA